MSDEQFAKDYLTQLHDLLPKLDTSKIADVIAAMRTVRDNGKMVYICGNGGKFVDRGSDGRRYREMCLSAQTEAIQNALSVGQYFDADRLRQRRGIRHGLCRTAQEVRDGRGHAARNQREREQPQRAESGGIRKFRRLLDGWPDHRRRRQAQGCGHDPADSPSFPHGTVGRLLFRDDAHPVLLFH